MAPWPTVLNVRAVADGDGRNIATDDGPEPYGALVAHGDIAHDGCVLAEVAVAAPFRGHAFVCLDECHVDCFCDCLRVLDCGRKGSTFS